MNNPVTERVDTELWDVDDVLPHQISLPSLVQNLEPVVEPGDLAQGKPGLITAGSALLLRTNNTAKHSKTALMTDQQVATLS